MKRMLGIIIILILSMPALVCAKEIAPLNVPIVAHAWASKRINGAIWGVATGDIDGDKKNEIVLLERNAVRVGSIEGDNLKIDKSYEWKGELQGVRIFLKNIDDDPAEEILISAVFHGMPDSFALKWEDGNFKTVFENARWNLRVTNDGTLLGQQRDYQTFFAGLVCELSFDSTKLKAGKYLRLPWWAKIYDFTMLPDERIMRLSGNEPLLLYERQGKRLKKVWSSGVRYGGTLNIIEATEREPLGMTNDDDVPIDKEPEVVNAANGILVIAPQHDIPLKGVIGKRPFIRNGKLVAWREDPSLGFSQAFETEEVPGYISDFVIDSKRIIASIQQNPSMWYGNQQSVILIFDLPR